MPFHTQSRHINPLRGQFASNATTTVLLPASPPTVPSERPPWSQPHSRPREPQRQQESHQTLGFWLSTPALLPRAQVPPPPCPGLAQGHLAGPTCVPKSMASSSTRLHVPPAALRPLPCPWGVGCPPSPPGEEPRVAITWFHYLAGHGPQSFKEVSVFPRRACSLFPGVFSPPLCGGEDHLCCKITEGTFISLCPICPPPWRRLYRLFPPTDFHVAKRHEALSAWGSRAFQEPRKGALDSEQKRYVNGHRAQEAVSSPQIRPPCLQARAILPHSTPQTGKALWRQAGQNHFESLIHIFGSFQRRRNSFTENWVPYRELLQREEH